MENKFAVAAGLEQEFIRLRPKREGDREAVLVALCTRTFKTRTIVFFGSKKDAHRARLIFGLAGSDLFYLIDFYFFYFFCVTIFIVII